MAEQGAAAAITRLLEKGIPFKRAPLEAKPNDEGAKAKEPEEEIEEISSTSQEESTGTHTRDSQYFGRVRIEGDYRDSSQQENETQKRKTAELGRGQLLKRAIHAASVQPKPRAHPKAAAASKAVPPFST